MSLERKVVEEEAGLDAVTEKQRPANQDAYEEEIDYSEHDLEHDSQIFIKFIGGAVLLAFLGFFFTFIFNPTTIPDKVANKKQNKEQQQTENLHRQVYEETNKGYSIIKPRVPVAPE